MTVLMFAKPTLRPRAVVSLEGRLDVRRLDDLSAVFDGAPDGDLDLDLAQVVFLDAFALQLLDRVIERRGLLGGRVRVVASSMPARVTLELTGRSWLLEVAA